MQQPNVLNFATRREWRPKALPTITRLVEPKTRLQRCVVWAARKLGLLDEYTPVVETVTRVAVRLEGDARDVIGRAILSFMKDDMRLDPRRDLIILWGSEEFTFFRYRSAAQLVVTDMVFARDNYRYRDIEVRVVPYLTGPLVLRRRDLQ